MEDFNFLVRVSCMTYNQAHYIVDAMNGFCMQETTFPFVCTIVDDASTDGEQDVIKNFLEAHFDLEDPSVVRNEETDDYYLTFAQHKTNKNCYFAVLFLKYNHYSIRKPKKPYIEEWCDTKYIALCEGDDYWIDPQKLQKQVEYLEKHPSCVLCYTKAKVYDVQYKTFNQETIGVDCGKDAFLSLLRQNLIPTLTVVYRNSALQGYYSYIEGKQWRMGDYPLWLYLALKGDVTFLDTTSSVYRMCKESASHSEDYSKQEEFEKSTLDIKSFFIDKSGKGDLCLVKQLSYQKLFLLAYDNKRYSDAKYYYKMYEQHTIKERIKFIISIICS